ncbi:MAG: DUF2934 domain-containing protein [Pseudomonadota bacterium]
MSGNQGLTRQRIEDMAQRLWEEAGSPQGGPAEFLADAKAAIAEEEAKVDKESEQSFPASDPPSSSGITGPTGDVAAVSNGDQ